MNQPKSALSAKMQTDGPASEVKALAASEESLEAMMRRIISEYKAKAPETNRPHSSKPTHPRPPTIAERDATSGAETMPDQNALLTKIARHLNHPTRLGTLARPTALLPLQLHLSNRSAQTEVEAMVVPLLAHIKGAALKEDSNPALKIERRLEPQRTTPIMEQTRPTSPTRVHFPPLPIQTTTTGKMRMEKIDAQ
jgi:hypothetical protein